MHQTTRTGKPSLLSQLLFAKPLAKPKAAIGRQHLLEGDDEPEPKPVKVRKPRTSSPPMVGEETYQRLRAIVLAKPADEVFTFLALSQETGRSVTTIRLTLNRMCAAGEVFFAPRYSPEHQRVSRSSDAILKNAKRPEEVRADKMLNLIESGRMQMRDIKQILGFCNDQLAEGARLLIARKQAKKVFMGRGQDRVVLLERVAP